MEIQNPYLKSIFALIPLELVVLYSYLSAKVIPADASLVLAWIIVGAFAVATPFYIWFVRKLELKDIVLHTLAMWLYIISFGGRPISSVPFFAPENQWFIAAIASILMLVPSMVSGTKLNIEMKKKV